MATHIFKAKRYYNVIGTFPPELTIASGDTVVVRTIDANGEDETGRKRAPQPNPMCGPIAIEGAEPGDALRIVIEAMTPTRKTGWTRAALAQNVVDPGAVGRLPKRERATWTINAKAGTAKLADPPPALKRWSVPLAPMIGCFGVAPSLGQAISTATSGEHGGNMDYRVFGPGTTVWLPVFATGALFFLGDCHASQGDGEIVIGWPRGETAEDIFTIGNARPLDQALQHATTEMLDWLGTDYGLDVTAASHVLGQVMRYDVGNVYDPAYTMACRIGKKWLPKRKGP